jgi:membrane protease YdiL (CAAX protease family)
MLLLQLVVLALGKEIAWRAFFQNRITKHIPIIPATLITSTLFAIGHTSDGDILAVSYNIFFVFINSILHGIVFIKLKTHG